MIEHKFVAEKLKEFRVQEFIKSNLKNAGFSHAKLQKTPLGEKITVFTSHPGLVVGRKGENIKKMTQLLKERFGLENPQIEISEVEQVNLDADIVAERIASTLERFGSSKFKAVGHKTMADVIGAGALGVEILMSGKIPGSRAKIWRFYQGYLKKCGDVALVGVRKAYASALLKTGIVGVQVRIMPPDIILPDKVKLIEPPVEVVEEVKEGKEPDDKKGKEKEEKKEEKPNKKKSKSKKKEVEETNEDKGPKSDE